MLKRITGNVFAVFVIFIVLALIIPLNEVMGGALLDFLLLVNISLSVVILLMTMYIKEALEFSSFPTILLITTVFRLSLNISTTRGILSTGYAGSVIETFGNFVMGGDPIVGFIIFIIIVLVNFLVITKGSERVSEVAARFTLDAMPGKQMAIDADLNTGAITDEEAKIRRANVQREADFFGAMDGATKFVKGDAIISIITALVNLIAGAVIGMMNGGDFNAVLSTYSLATVGDGLCSQIPALLISVATGMVVTRSASTGSFNEDVKIQFTRNSTVMFITGGVCIVLMLIPGFPSSRKSIPFEPNNLIVQFRISCADKISPPVFNRLNIWYFREISLSFLITSIRTKLLFIFICKAFGKLSNVSPFKSLTISHPCNSKKSSSVSPNRSPLKCK